MLALIVTILLLVGVISNAQAAFMVTRVATDNDNFSATGATNTISLVTVEDASNGALRFLVPALNVTSEANDGVADPGYYDFGAAVVQCPADVDGYDFDSGIAIAVDTALFVYQGQSYHIFTCPYTGNGPAGTDFGISNLNSAVITGLINPAISETHLSSGLTRSPGEAIFVPWLVQKVNQYDDVVESQLTWPNYLEDVQVQAEILPYFTFVVSGVAESTVACNIVTARSSSASLVDFGEIGNGFFVDMAQELYLASNYPDGYVVTITSNDQMSRVVGGTRSICSGKTSIFDDCLPNSTVWGMNTTVSRPWTNPTQGTGLAYTLGNISGSDSLFDYVDGYRHLPDTEAGDLPVPILRFDDSNETYNHVCYRLNSLSNNLPGLYENTVTYTATASF